MTKESMLQDIPHIYHNYSQYVWHRAQSVSYTHLDVYKRQIERSLGTPTVNGRWGWKKRLTGNFM